MAQKGAAECPRSACCADTPPSREDLARGRGMPGPVACRTYASDLGVESGDRDLELRCPPREDGWPRISRSQGEGRRTSRRGPRIGRNPGSTHKHAFAPHHLAHRHHWSALRWPCQPPTSATSPGPRWPWCQRRPGARAPLPPFYVSSRCRLSPPSAAARGPSSSCPAPPRLRPQCNV